MRYMEKMWYRKMDCIWKGKTMTNGVQHQKKEGRYYK